MYNDYYLQQINNNIIANGNYLEDLQTQVQQLHDKISGDNLLLRQKVDKNASLICIPITIILILLFVIRSMK